MEVVKYFIFIYIFIEDIKKKIIPEKSFVILMILGFIETILKKDFENWYIGIAIYSLPLIVIYTVEDYFKKELIGYGDIKLMMAIGGFLKYTNLLEVFNFYKNLYILSGVFSVIIIFYSKIKKIKIEYIPFAPFIIITYILYIYLF